MQLTIPLDKMTTADKLRALEDIWSNLQRTPDEVPSPAWHADVLQARENRVREGASQFGDWADAKHRIREQTR
ncbi:Putative addiction module component [Desulfonatronum thiosulfatophilum]|uniref:Putative addiction module component n=1 Tax=Desulfonatronum thiosulfatophilum TaxID=617002 RepID=A0A1G6BVN8_9BACT|nr:Putative addiction module component [Desulfonatronum thiosulfatophilum]